MKNKKRIVILPVLIIIALALLLYFYYLNRLRQKINPDEQSITTSISDQLYCESDRDCYWYEIIPNGPHLDSKLYCAGINFQEKCNDDCVKLSEDKVSQIPKELICYCNEANRCVEKKLVN